MSFLTGLIGSIAGASGEWADREIKDRQTQEAEQRAYDQRVDLAKLQAQIEVEKANAIDVAKRARDELQRQSDAEAITAEAGRAGEERFQRNKVDLGYDDSADYDHPANAKSMEDVRQGIIGRATQGGSMDRLEAAARLGIESKPDQVAYKAQLDTKNAEEKLSQANAKMAAAAEHEKRLREDAAERNKALTERATLQGELNAAKTSDARLKALNSAVTDAAEALSKAQANAAKAAGKEPDLPSKKEAWQQSVANAIANDPAVKAAQEQLDELRRQRNQLMGGASAGGSTPARGSGARYPDGTILRKDGQQYVVKNGKPVVIGRG